MELIDWKWGGVARGANAAFARAARRRDGAFESWSDSAAAVEEDTDGGVDISARGAILSLAEDARDCHDRSGVMSNGSETPSWSHTSVQSWTRAWCTPRADGAYIASRRDRAAAAASDGSRAMSNARRLVPVAYVSTGGALLNFHKYILQYLLNQQNLQLEFLYFLKLHLQLPCLH